MDKYERRRRALIRIKDEECGGVVAKLADALQRAPSYVARMLYPEGKDGKKRIGDDMVEIIESRFPGWLSGGKPAHSAVEMDATELDLLQKWRSLPDAFKHIVAHKIDNLLRYWNMLPEYVRKHVEPPSDGEYYAWERSVENDMYARLLHSDMPVTIETAGYQGPDRRKTNVHRFPDERINVARYAYEEFIQPSRRGASAGKKRKEPGK